MAMVIRTVKLVWMLSLAIAGVVSAAIVANAVTAISAEEKTRKESERMINA
jgi:hypothetical protein